MAAGREVQAEGQRLGLTPAIGMPFITPSALPSPTPYPGGTGTVAQPSVSGVSEVELVGNPSSLLGATSGGVLILQVLAPTSSSVTTRVPTAPVNGSTMSFRLVMKSASNPTQ